MIKLAYGGEIEYNNTKCIVLNGTFFGTYGVNGVGDLLNLTPSQNQGVDGGIADANSAYNSILELPPNIYGILNENLGGSYVGIKPNAVPTLTNFGLQMFEPGGTEKATNAAYTASELAGSVKLIFAIPALQ